jgi:CPA1 family monovalent cation:H+ antiporter
MHDDATLGALEVFVVLLAVVVGVAIAARRATLPYSVALVLFGLAVSAIAPPLGLAITPELVLAVLLPGLVFEAAFQIDVRHLRRSFAGVILLAGPGVVIVAGLVAVVLHVATGLPLELAFVVGAMVSATDPAAVIAAIRRVRAPERLETLVEAESLFNDGTGIVIFALALSAVGGGLSLGEGVVRFMLTVAISAGLGAIAGTIGSWLATLVEDHLVELTITVVVAYGSYLLADRLGQSGLIATVVAGIVLGTYGGRIGMTEESRRAIDIVWAYLAFLLTALVFLLIGLAIRPADLIAAGPAIVWGVVAILLGRALVVYGLLGLLDRTIGARWPSTRVPVAWQHVLFWGGLRGAVAVALALSLPPDLPQRGLLQGVTFGIVLFTLLVQGTTSGLVLRLSGAHRALPEGTRAS